MGPPMLVFSCRLRPLVKFLQGFSEGFLLLPASFSSTFLLSFYGFLMSHTAAGFGSGTDGLG